MGNTFCCRMYKEEEFRTVELLLPGMISNSSLLHLIGRDEELKILDCTYSSDQEDCFSTFKRVSIPGYI